MYRPTFHSTRAFSLLELLAVMAIVALLIAILLPSLSKAREHANRTNCLNHIRQIGLGISLYSFDHRELPPPDAEFAAMLANQIGAQADSEKVMSATMTPAFYAARRSGLLALSIGGGFERRALACPEGWASGGNPEWYAGPGISRIGSAYMDYAYWPGRYAPGEQYDVRAASFKYRLHDRGTRILATDIITEIATVGRLISLLGYGNHGTNHGTRPLDVPMTDGRGQQLTTLNAINSKGGSVLFSDYRAEWFAADRFTQQAGGLCYPPPDQW